MKSLLLDTNILIDLLARREPYFNEAAKLFSLADKKKVNLFASALSFANIHYVLLRKKKPEEAKAILRKLKLIVGVLSLDEKILSLSLNDNDFRDYEDSLQYYTAMESRMDGIISRNLRDFKSSKLPVMSAEQFLKAQR